MTLAGRLLFGVVILSYLALVNFTSIGQLLERRGFAIFQAAHSPHPDIVILAIDQKSLESIGRWPWSRQVHADFLNKLKAAEPLVVGIDIAFTAPEADQPDESLAQSIAQLNAPVVLAAEPVYVNSARTPDRIVSPLELLTKLSNVTVGHVTIPVDGDGRNRSLPIPITVAEKRMEPMTFAVARELQASLPIEPEHLLVNFAGPAGSFPTYSISDVLEGKVSDELLKHKILLIGATAADLHDTVLVPLVSPLMAGVEWQANVIDNLLLGRPIRILNPWISFLMGLGISLLFLAALPRFSARSLTIWLIGVAVALPGISFLLWQTNRALPYVSNLLLVIGLFIFHNVFRWLKAEAEKRQLRESIAPHFSPQIIRLILDDPDQLKLGGQLREVTILFSDIRSFTTISESLSPEKLIELLREYFTEMSEEVLATDGVIDKYIGDAIMAFWGAPFDQPDHADRAVKTAIGMIRRLERLQTKWQAAGYPFVDIGVGINTGLATVGNMGSTKRFNYTAMGDTTNAASRLEGLNKEFKTHIIISEKTKEKLTVPVTLRELGDVLVKGKTVPIKIHEVIPDPSGD